MDDDRVSTLEETVAKLQAQGIETQTKLDLLIASMERLAQNNKTPESPVLE